MSDRRRGDPESNDEDGGVTDVPESVQLEVAELLSDDASTGIIAGESHGDLAPIEANLVRVDDTPPLGTSQGRVEGAEPGRVVDIEATADDTAGLIVIGGEGDDVLLIDSVDAEVAVIDADDLDRVVIVDDDKPDPRFEERRQRNERLARIRKFRWVRITAVVVVLVVATLGALASPLFGIRSVTVEGAVYTSDETLAAAEAQLRGHSLFSLDKREIEKRIENDPWVEEARVSLSFPPAAFVEINERSPVVWFVGTDNKARVIDIDGRVLAVLEGWPTDYLQVGGTGPAVEAGSRVDVVYRAAAQLVAALPDELRDDVREAGVAAGNEVTLTLKSGTLIRFGPPTNLQNKLVAVVVLLRRLDPASLASIDVSTGEATYLNR